MIFKFLFPYYSVDHYSKSPSSNWSHLIRIILDQVMLSCKAFYKIMKECCSPTCYKKERWYKNLSFSEMMHRDLSCFEITLCCADYEKEENQIYEQLNGLFSNFRVNCEIRCFWIWKGSVSVALIERFVFQVYCFVQKGANYTVFSQSLITDGAHIFNSDFLRQKFRRQHSFEAW